MELTPGVRRIGNEIVACYLFIDDRGVTLVDAGLAGHYDDLVDELAAAGRTLDDLRAVILTHGDTDHIGFAERLRRDHGVPVYVHEADAARARGGDTPSTSFGRGIRPWPIVRFFAYALGKGGAKTEYLTEVRTVVDGDRLDLPGSPVIVGMPGHSPGSIAVHSPELDAVCVGDALTTRHVLTGRRGPQPAPFTDEPDEAIASLDRLAALDATWVLPGHGTPWNGGTADAVRLVREAAASVR
ncbi:MBL fold metallo-hydrolase [Agromyces aurantiacus]|uniref:MBL fold metallo-hydrolase n=1 Tax=Agromyces aurantiacus TaxID=165814 RepID=A0ABV9R7V0_9MICO|nr:MBL fold metallo-hydrolase [Agromyces aurantiacus]MBM7504439.1 glyoxylase-like metal-dependent hydrolase (beta-lactamase superfamily II) [Agromyces aurantiacus]